MIFITFQLEVRGANFTLTISKYVSGFPELLLCRSRPVSSKVLLMVLFLEFESWDLGFLFLSLDGRLR